MTTLKHLSIAVIGNEDLVKGLRLVGISKYYVIDEQNAGEAVRVALNDLLDQPDIGIIVIMEDYVSHAEDLLTQIRESKRLTPVIIEVPSKDGAKQDTVSEYYKAYIRKFIGFDISI
jgi:vacuolar-type H+-ATPase subunit F/Vma7